MRCEEKTTLNVPERKAVLELLARSFPPNYLEAKNNFEFFLNEAPNKIYLLAWLEAELVGVLCLLGRSFNYFGIPLRATGMSYMAAERAHANFSATEVLKEKMFVYIEKHSDLSIGFARKVMDGYWYPYGYLGFTNFGELMIERDKLRGRNSGFSHTPVQEEHLARIGDLFSETYRNVLGSLVRNSSLWSYYLKKAERDRTVFRALWKDAELIGYFVVNGNRVLELGVGGIFLEQMPGFLKSYFQEQPALDGTIVFEIGQTHPLTRILRKFVHTVSQRHAWNGGHIVRIHSIPDFLRKSLPIFEERLRNARTSDFLFQWGGLSFGYQGGHLEIEGRIDESLHFDWQKLVLGILSPKDILNSTPSVMGTMAILFPVVSPQVPYFDQL